MARETRLPRIGSAVIVVDRDQVLLGVRAKEPNRGKWVIPGGKIEEFESIEDAAKREIREETGLEIELQGQETIKEIIAPPNEHRLIIYSRARVVGGSLSASSDLENVGFFSRSELSSLDLSDVVREVLGDLGWLQPLSVAA